MPDRIGIVALDLDGTLLDSQKCLSDANRAALERAAADGIQIVPTTGRFFGMMPPVVRDLPFVRYAITVNGAEVYDRVEDKVVVREEIPVEMAVGIMQLLDGFDVIYDCYRNGWGWITSSLQAKAEEYTPDEHYLKAVREFRHPVPDLKAHLRDTTAEGDVQKVMLFARKEGDVTDVLGGIRREVGSRFPEIKITASTRNNLELNIASANKGRALGRLAEHLGLTLANCMAFGDGLNDLTMIQAAGVGVAMANAVDEVKRAANIVTVSNDDDGVAAVLNERQDWCPIAVR